MSELAPKMKRMRGKKKKSLRRDVTVHSVCIIHTGIYTPDVTHKRNVNFRRAFALGVRGKDAVIKIQSRVLSLHRMNHDVEEEKLLPGAI